MRNGRLTLGLVPLIAVLLGACTGAASTPPTASSSAGGSPAASSTPGLPADPATLVLQVRSAGGLMAPDYLFRDVPGISVFADGRAIISTGRRDLHTGTLLPGLVAGRLDAGQVGNLLAAAADAGLASGTDASYPSRGVADVPPTTFIVRASRGVTRTTFGALGAGVQPDDPVEVAARAGARAFTGRLAGLMQSIGSEPYRPAVVRLAVRGYAVTDPAYVRDPVPWPLAWPLATAGTPVSASSPDLGRCVLVSGADLDRLWPVMASADGTTPFTSGGGRYALTVRPLLPDEAARCP